MLGIILAVIGAAVQAAPLMKGEDWEAKVFHLPSGSRKKRGGLPTGRKKKVVKKTKVVQKGSAKKTAKDKELEKRRSIFTDDDYDDGDYDSDYQPPEEEATDRGDREDLDRTQEYQVGQRQYEPREKQQIPYMGSGIGIDLDDLNRELSQEIKKIYKDDSQ